jgi:hypothetical protein
MLARGRLTYYDLVLGRDKKGPLRVLDLHALTDGFLKSESLRKDFVEMIGPQNRPWVGKLVGVDPLWLTNLDVLLAMDKADDDSQYEAALREFDRLPEVLRRQPILLDAGLLYARLTSEEQYDRLLALACDVAKTEPILRMRVLNALSDREVGERTFEMLKLVDEAVGGDAYLDVYRAGLLESQGKKPEALAAAEAALKRDPALIEAYEWCFERLLRKKRREPAPEKAQRLQHAAALWQQLEAAAAGNPRLEEFRKENQELGEQLKRELR